MAGFDGLSGSTGDDTVNASESRVLEGVSAPVQASELWVQKRT